MELAHRFTTENGACHRRARSAPQAAAHRRSNQVSNRASWPGGSGCMCGCHSRLARTGQWPQGALDGIVPIATDSVLARRFKPSVYHGIAWEGTPATRSVRPCWRVVAGKLVHLSRAQTDRSQDGPSTSRRRCQRHIVVCAASGPCAQFLPVMTLRSWLDEPSHSSLIRRRSGLKTQCALGTPHLRQSHVDRAVRG